ncbi:hypothetical protein TNCT_479561 [Trichonephila clavata]|uniref:Uncharacterized protein n=1 Tax=Trichonephila clavata TaxID=2740835 RepID=A0A8X6H5I8_TRICU|nr:hypothetical protein TNCT_479561 [Trichonephila clavata]
MNILHCTRLMVSEAALSLMKQGKKDVILRKQCSMNPVLSLLTGATPEIKLKYGRIMNLQVFSKHSSLGTKKFQIVFDFICFAANHPF